jgi:hypothetical protein
MLPSRLAIGMETRTGAESTDRSSGVHLALKATCIQTTNMRGMIRRASARLRWVQNQAIKNESVNMELSSFERQVLNAFLTGPGSTLETLRAQASVLAVSSREHTGSGAYIKFEVPDSVIRVHRAESFWMTLMFA